MDPRASTALALIVAALVLQLMDRRRTRTREREDEDELAGRHLSDPGTLLKLAPIALLLVATVLLLTMTF